MLQGSPARSLLLAALLATPASAEQNPAAPKALPGAPTADEIVDCVRANLPESTARQRVLFRTRDRAGSEREVRSTVKWRRFDDSKSRVMVRVQEPRDLRGAGLEGADLRGAPLRADFRGAPLRGADLPVARRLRA